eukprot:7064646-Prymnesium_polylepis.1
MLIGGEDGAHVVEYLREQLEASAQRGGRPYSVNSLKTYVSNVKSKVLEEDYRKRECDFSGLRCFADEPEVLSFLTAPLKVQLEMKRRHLANPT